MEEAALFIACDKGVNKGDSEEMTYSAGSL